MGKRSVSHGRAMRDLVSPAETAGRRRGPEDRDPCIKQDPAQPSWDGHIFDVVEAKKRIKRVGVALSGVIGWTWRGRKSQSFCFPEKKSQIAWPHCSCRNSDVPIPESGAVHGSHAPTPSGRRMRSMCKEAPQAALHGTARFPFGGWHLSLLDVTKTDNDLLR